MRGRGKLLGPDRTLGITCHDSRHLAMEAGEVGADYVAFGAFFPTATKAAQHRADPEMLAWWSEMIRAALRCHRRHHRGELRAPGPGRGGFPGGGRRRLEPSGRPGGGRTGDERAIAEAADGA